MKPEVLYVDDEVENLKVFQRIFKKEYTIHTAPSGEEGLKIFEAKHSQLHLVISDQRMPGMSGVDFLNTCRQISTAPIRILITGYADLESTINAINEAEIYRFIKKPWEALDLKQTLFEAQEKFELKRELNQKNIALSEANQQLQSIDELKNKFMMLVNHELKTPVTIQKSFLELLNETGLSEEQVLFLEKARHGTEKLESLIEEILFLLNLEAHSELKQSQKFDPKKTLPSLFEFDADLQFIESESILTHKDYFEEALKRVLQNAHQHKLEGSTVEITCEKKNITIKNKIAPEKAPLINQIVKPFEIDENPLHHTKGLGLGLSVALLIFKKLNIQTQLKVDDYFTISIASEA